MPTWINLAWTLAYADVRNRYRRSIIGPFWITIAMGVMVASIGFVFGSLFKSPMQEFLPFITVGLIIWAYITGTIQEGSMSFIDAEGTIKQLHMPMFVHVLRVLFRNLIILAHNALIFPLVLFLMNGHFSVSSLLFLPGLFLIFMCLSWITPLLAIICTRYRDVSQIIISILQVMFYLTPIIWMPALLTERVGEILLQFNPFFHFLEVTRAPLLGELPNPMSYIILIAMAILGWIISLYVYFKKCHRVAYWL